MTGPNDVLSRLNSGDIIRFRTRNEDTGECEAEVITSTIKGVRIDTTSEDNLFEDSSSGLWIEQRKSIDEDYPVLTGAEDTEPVATIIEIEVIEDNSLLG